METMGGRGRLRGYCRCAGLEVPIQLRDDQAGDRAWASHCLVCGNVDDAVMLEHRQMVRAPRAGAVGNGRAGEPAGASGWGRD
jgi:hypothetical protein